MDERIRQLESTTLCGYRFTRRQLSDMQRTVADFPALSRHELARTVCEHLGWSDDPRKPRHQTCLTVLQRLEELGVLQLPPGRPRRGGPRKPPPATARSDPQDAIEVPLRELMPITLRVVTDTDGIGEWNEWVQRYHYLGYRHPVGRSLRYFIEDGRGRRLGCIGFGYAARRLPCRDEWVGWQDQKHRKHLDRVVNNSRFVIFPWVRVRNLASKALSLAVRRVADDWHREHGVRPVLAETFVDSGRFRGSCYRGAGWHCVGVTERQSGKTPKQVYVYPLEPAFRDILRNGRVPRAGRGPSALPQPSADGADAFVGLWRRIIGVMTEIAGDHDREWQTRRRVVDTQLVMLFIFRLVFSHNRQGYQITINELWRQCRSLGLTLPQEQPVSAAAMCQARKKVDERVFRQLHERVLSESCDDRSGRHNWHGHRLYAVDGSKINLPRELTDAGYRLPHRAHYPQGLVSVLYQLQRRIPVDFELVPHADERLVALDHLRCLDRNDVVIYDRGYYSYEMLDAHVRRGVHVIFRMQRNSAAAVDRFIESGCTDQQVTISVSADTRRKIRRKNPKMRRFPAHRLRLVRYTHDDTVYHLATTLLDAAKYDIRSLSDAYHGRWGVEELYKTAKEHLAIEQFHGRTERGVRQELYAQFVLVTLSRLFAGHGEWQLRDIEPKPQGNHNRMRVNFKNALAVMGRHVEELMLRHSELVAQTVSEMLAAIRRCRYRERPNRSYERRSRQPVSKWNRGRSKKAAGSA